LGTFVSCEESNNNILSILFPVSIKKSKRAAVDFSGQCPLFSLVKVGLRLHRPLRSEDGKRKRLFEYAAQETCRSFGLNFELCI
jgi:hypothetical protein